MAKPFQHPMIFPQAWQGDKEIEPESVGRIPPGAPCFDVFQWMRHKDFVSGPGIVGPDAKGHTDHENTQPGGQMR